MEFDCCHAISGYEDRVLGLQCKSIVWSRQLFISILFGYSSIGSTIKTMHLDVKLIQDWICQVWMLLSLSLSLSLWLTGDSVEIPASLSPVKKLDPLKDGWMNAWVLNVDRQKKTKKTSSVTFNVNVAWRLCQKAMYSFYVNWHAKSLQTLSLSRTVLQQLITGCSG